ncbi:MAG TPA: hypothetical protein DCQ06_02085 [Myxococcales bacterium]|nr:hypothetical protein [Myxococcales bacterium]
MRSSLLIGSVVIASVLATSGCGIPKDKHYAALEAERTRSADELEQAQKAAQAKWQAEHKKLKNIKDYADGQKIRSDKLERALQTTRKALAETAVKGGKKGKALAKCALERSALLGRLNAIQAVTRKVRESLKSMSDAGKLQVKLERGFLIIGLQGDILFDTGRSKLKDGAKPVLLELGEILKKTPGRLFQVAGHTDSTGKDDRNWRLSIDRAWAVVEFLLKEAGVPGQVLSVGGYGSWQPTADNNEQSGRATNRRVELLLIPNLTELFK